MSKPVRHLQHFKDSRRMACGTFVNREDWDRRAVLIDPPPTVDGLALVTCKRCQGSTDAKMAYTRAMNRMRRAGS